jgi:predicted MFS family arabinose efflux permease
VIGRNIPAERRSWAMGVAAAAGSFGQFLMVPVEGWLIASLGWQTALLALAAAVMLIAPLAWGLREPAALAPGGVKREQTIWQALREAFKYRSFQLLMAGYFVCGFQVVFIGVHMPSYLKDNGLSPQVASYALALIGLFNVFGTYAAGALGQRWPKKNILAGIYLLRSVAISVFLLAPLTPASVYVFASVMGVLWLSTVPPTNAVVAQIFGVQHFSMLGGFVFFSHQIGSFMGVWLGGVLYDRTGSYDIVWQIAIALGVFAALINLPVKETAIQRRAQAAAA